MITRAVLQEDEKPGVASPSPAKKAKAGAGGVAPASALDAETQELVELIFSEDMFKSAMADMELDVKKMPLGALSQAQVQKGYAVLAELECAPPSPPVPSPPNVFLYSDNLSI